MLYEMIDQHEIFDKTLMEPFKKLLVCTDYYFALIAGTHEGYIPVFHRRI